jgi:hypothetical protein
MPDPSAERQPRCPSRAERCSLCGAPATHKVGEEIPWDDPVPDRHNLTAYVCCAHFRLILGYAVRCGELTTEQQALESLRHENRRLRWRLNHQTEDDAEACRQGRHPPDCGR